MQSRAVLDTVSTFPGLDFLRDNSDDIGFPKQTGKSFGSATVAESASGVPLTEATAKYAAGFYLLTQHLVELVRLTEIAEIHISNNPAITALHVHRLTYHLYERLAAHQVPANQVLGLALLRAAVQLRDFYSVRATLVTFPTGIKEDGKQEFLDAFRRGMYLDQSFIDPQQQGDRSRSLDVMNMKALSPNAVWFLDAVVRSLRDTMSALEKVTPENIQEVVVVNTEHLMSKLFRDKATRSATSRSRSVLMATVALAVLGTYLTNNSRVARRFLSILASPTLENFGAWTTEKQLPVGSLLRVASQQSLFLY